MKEKIKNLSNKKIVITSLCVFAIVLLLGFTYAYWSRTFSQTGENISTYDCFDIAFSENTDGISMESGYPISDEEGLKTESYEVTITNTCKTAASYNVILNKLNTSTLDDSHVKVAVNGNIKLLSETATTTSNITNTSGARIINNGVLAGEQTRTIKIQNWMDSSTSEEQGANKTFSYKITIEALAKNNTLKNVILANNQVSSKKADITYSPLSKESYDKMPASIKEDYGYEDIYINENGLYKSEDDDGETMFFRGEVNNNYVKLGNLKYNEDKYVYQLHRYKNLDRCIRSWGEEYCNRKLGSAGENILWRIVRINGDGTIRLVLDDSIAAGPWQNTITSKEQIGFTYKELTNKYHTVQKNLEGLKLSLGMSGTYYYADEYTIDENTGMHTLKNPVAITGAECFANHSLCVNKYTLHMDTADASRKTMYKVVSIDDTYVKYNAEFYTGEAIYNDTSVNSTIKNTLEEWYQTHLSDFDKYVATSTFCNDTKAEYWLDDRIVYSHYMNSTSSFKCSETNESYGGKYKTKIGLLSDDEVRHIAGGGYNFYSYLANVPSFWTMTPSDFTGNSTAKQYYYEVGQRNTASPTQTYIHVRPVINLKVNIKVDDGDGTKNNPYVIE